MQPALREHGVARVVGSRPGPTLVVTGGVHGNEPAGLEAARRVLAELDPARVRGRVVAVAGNITALDQRRRYVDRDLNRKWEPATIEALRRSGPSGRVAEEHDQHELLTLFGELAEDAVGPMVFLDLHTTSGESPPFICVADTLANRELAMALPIPIILGLEEVIDGSMIGWLCDQGHLGVAIEGGRHDDPQSVDRHASAIWLVLVAAGLVDRADVPDFDAHHARVAAATREFPPVLEIRHRQVTRDGDGFVMDPGWKSFQPVEAGTVVARDAEGAIPAPRTGLMLMPRYQPQGEDGFFVMHPISPFWLRVSAWLRRLRLDRLVPLLPGVSRDPADPERFLVGERWMPPQVVNVMHLFGYRRLEPASGRFVFSRRREQPRLR